MHPTLARFLDVGKALALLGRSAAGTDPDEAAFLRAAKEDAEAKGALLDAKGREHPGPDAQQALVVLAVRAAIARLADDPALAGPAAAARAALSKEGATDDEVQQFLGTVLLEEGFADETEPDTFDLEFVRETLDTIPTLASLEQDAVDALVERFARAQAQAARPAAVAVAEAVLEAAWAEGLQPVMAEHVDQAVATLAEGAGQKDLEAVGHAARAWIAHLHASGVVGPLRRKRLDLAAARALEVAAAGGDTAEMDAEDDLELTEPGADPDDEPTKV